MVKEKYDETLCGIDFNVDFIADFCRVRQFRKCFIRFDRRKQNMADNARPEIEGTVENMDDYDTIFIGYPNWWGDMPMIVYNFLESYDLSGKTIVPFCTHGGSGLSGTESTIEDITGGTMADGFAIAGTTAQNDRDTAGSEVTEWLKEGGFVE